MYQLSAQLFYRGHLVLAAAVLPVGDVICGSCVHAFVIRIGISSVSGGIWRVQQLFHLVIHNGLDRLTRFRRCL